MNFLTINPKELNDNIFKLWDNDWTLITAGVSVNFNTMTASWGGLGILWNKPVATIFVRPQRYTYEFTEKSDIFTLSFFEEKYRKTLQLCGTKSGREIDKMNGIGLTHFSTENGGIAFEEARLILECRKVYFGDLKKENFVMQEVAKKNYPIDDFHRFYIGEITNVLKKSNL